SAGLYYATYPEGGVAGNYKFTPEEWDASYRPIFGILTKQVFKDHTICKTVVDQFFLLLVERLEEKVANMTGLELQVAAFKKQVSRLNDKLTSSDASFAKSKAKGKERKKNIKSLGKSLDNVHGEVARLGGRKILSFFIFPEGFDPLALVEGFTPVEDNE
ncbi:hypothetical protein Tco_0249282, partial [Tanacetum coccineum]